MGKRKKKRGVNEAKDDKMTFESNISLSKFGRRWVF